MPRTAALVVTIAALAATAPAGPPRYTIQGFAPPPPPNRAWEDIGGTAITDDARVLLTATDDLFYNQVSFLYDPATQTFEPIPFQASDLANGPLICGSYRNVDNRSRANIRRPDGTLVYLEPLGGNWYDEIAANAVNNSGQAVGWSTDDSGDIAWIWDAAAGLQPLSTADGRLTWAMAINDSAKVAGWDQSANAALWDDGQIIPLGVLGVGQLWPAAINNADRIVGRYRVDPFGFRAFLWHDGDLQDLGDLGEGDVFARDINDQGHIVGAADVNDAPRAVIWTDAQPRDLNHQIAPDAGWVLQDAGGINSLGQITGRGRYHGQPMAFILTPTCDADFDGDGAVNTLDFLTFLNAWNLGLPSADWNNDAQFNTLDLIAFLADWASGCP
jgi:hypothetical protein